MDKYTKDELRVIYRFLEERRLDVGSAELEFDAMNRENPDGTLRLYRTRARWTYDYLTMLSEEIEKEIRQSEDS